MMDTEVYKELVRLKMAESAERAKTLLHTRVYPPGTTTTHVGAPTWKTVHQPTPPEYVAHIALRDRGLDIYVARFDLPNAHALTATAVHSISGTASTAITYVKIMGDQLLANKAAADLAHAAAKKWDLEHGGGV
jgi:hypothetical protein